ncbi:MAG TPA: translation elongation factor 4 [Candidatus Paceibacterota bacterium]|nr:translation elongation factor 4 [Candidatus Paceibacterota bacterium]HPP64868.1 translation elongation factor 4 [Candidatus Paceibacterota bacterium]
MTNIRNFVIIAHIDHGKSTLADRFLELTETVPRIKLEPQYLDKMNLEKEHGVTIKMHPVTMSYHNYVLNLIDTPGHVDFSFEVSRALKAVEGAILLVDITQGIQAQTISHLNLALKQNLKIIPVLNKIDLENYNLEDRKEELVKLLNIKPEEISLISAKNGTGVKELLERVIREIPPPKIETNQNFCALIFDSKFDYFKGIIAYVRVLEGKIKKGERFCLWFNKSKGEVLSLGYFSPELKEKETLEAGEIGWLATGLKEPDKIKVGDYLILENQSYELKETEFNQPKPMVYASFYLKKGDSSKEFENFRAALLKLKLNDWALEYAPETSEVLGRGFRLGFLGLFHLEIIQERLKEEYGLDLVVVNPTVPYRVKIKNQKEPIIITNPNQWPEEEAIEKSEEPWVEAEIITPSLYLAPVLKLISLKRGENIITNTFNEKLEIKLELPLEEVVRNFYDDLKSVSSGYASMDYKREEFYKPANLEKMEVLLAGKVFESLSQIVLKEKIEKEARSLALRLKELIPRQNYPVAIQIRGLGRIIARETIPSLKKDVTSHLYGGDRTRKEKLWEKQKKGKKKLLQKADLEIPSSVFVRLFTKKDEH